MVLLLSILLLIKQVTLRAKNTKSGDIIGGVSQFVSKFDCSVLITIIIMIVVLMIILTWCERFFLSLQKTKTTTLSIGGRAQTLCFTEEGKI